MSRHPVTVTETGDVRFLTTHPTLALVARTLCQSLGPGTERFGPTDIWLGAHRTRKVARTAGRRLIIVQTEQILDAEGNTIETKVSRGRIARMALGADLFVEWNPQNRPHYGLLPHLMPRRFLFGPYVFPSVPPPRKPGSGLVFIGAMTPRRRSVLETLPEPRRPSDRASVEEIDMLVSEGAAMLNIHSLPGTYTEVPRLLMACLAGKPLVSEPLGAPFDNADAYLTLDAARAERGLDAAALIAVHAGLSALARRYPVTEMLRCAHRHR